MNVPQCNEYNSYLPKTKALNYIMYIFNKYLTQANVQQDLSVVVMT